MRKVLFLVFFLVMMLYIGEAYALNAASMQGGNPDNWYMEVKFNPTATGFAMGRPCHGDVVEWDLDSDTGETLGVTVHLADSADAENVAGVVPSWDDTAHNLGDTVLVDGDTFLIQIRGYHSGVAAATGVTEGQSIENDANAQVTDGDGLGFAFKASAVNTSAKESSRGAGYFAPCWIDFDKGTN